MTRSPPEAKDRRKTVPIGTTGSPGIHGGGPARGGGDAAAVRGTPPDALPGLRRGSRSPAGVVAALRIAGDVVAVGLATWAGCALAGGPSGPRAWALAGTFALVVVAVFHFRGLYRDQVSTSHIGELERVVKGAFLAAVLLLALYGLSGAGEGLGSAPPIAAGLALGLLPASRRATIAVVGGLRRTTGDPRRILVYGCGETGRLVMKKVVQAPQLGWRVVGFLDDFRSLGSAVRCRPSQTSPQRVEARILGRLSDLEEVSAERGVDELLVAIPGPEPDLVRSILDRAGTLGIRVSFVPHLGSVRPHQLSVEELGAIPILRQVGVPRRWSYRVAKRGLDVVAAALLTVVLAPAWAVTAVLIRLDSPGPAFFLQERVGLEGRTFRMLKLRTMYSDAAPYAPAPDDDRDPRITRVGRWLRSAGFDETPQVLNVLRGQMSLVGPRPEMPFVVADYSRLERERLTVRPGITGLWQLGSDRQSQIHHNLEYDLHYVRNASLLLDVLILFETGVFAARVLLDPLLGAFRTMETGDASGASPTSRPDEFFVLFALDQRVNGRLGKEEDDLRRILRGAHEVARRWPVRILAARKNVELFDRLAAAADGRTDGRRPEYVAYRSRAGLETLAAEAGLVVTDIPSLARWARLQGIELLRVRGSGFIEGELSGEAADVAESLSRAVGERAAGDVPGPRLRSR